MRPILLISPASKGLIRVRRHQRFLFHIGDSNPLCKRGFTLIELFIVMALIGTLSAIAVPQYLAFLDKARVIAAIAEVHMLQDEVQAFKREKGFLPDNLSEVMGKPLLDPWKHPYQYTNLITEGKGKARKDKFLNPLNSDFDLYSVGKDGKTKKPLSPPDSHDDIIRALDGAYIGLAYDF